MWRDFHYCATLSGAQVLFCPPAKERRSEWGAIPQPRGIRMRYIASAEFSFRFVTLCRARIHGVNPVYCCAREDQPKRHAFAPRLKARQ